MRIFFWALQVLTNLLEGGDVSSVALLTPYNGQVRFFQPMPADSFLPTSYHSMVFDAFCGTDTIWLGMHLLLAHGTNSCL
jgi:hypothetical protein